MTKRELLEAAGLNNPHWIATDGHPYLTLYSDHGRGGRGSAWELNIKGRVFKNQPYYQYGRLWFKYSGRDQRMAALDQAIAKAKALFPDLDLVPNPGMANTYVAKTDLDAALKTARAKIATKTEENPT